MTKSLYVHIPFCKKICPFCDFVKCLYSKKTSDLYIDLLQKELIKKYKDNKFITIYIGGGTPNCLSNDQLIRLLSCLSKFLDKKFEFTIEINPEFVTNEQAKIFHLYKVNRVSIGIQTLDKIIQKTINRCISKQTLKNVIKTFKKNKITNISCDLIYGFKNQTILSIKKDIDFLINNDIKHFSFYSLEIKDDTPWYKQQYKIDELEIEDQLEFIIFYMKKKKYKRYEVSSWCKSNKFQSLHNVLVWQTNDWAALGYGAYGFENKFSYHYEGSINNWKLIKKKQSNFDIYYQVMLMGLRLTKGLDINNSLHRKAISFFHREINNDKLITQIANHVYCKNINLLDNFLIKLKSNEK